MLHAALRVAVPVVTLAGLSAAVVLTVTAPADAGSAGGSGLQTSSARSAGAYLLADQTVSAALPDDDPGAVGPREVAAGARQQAEQQAWQNAQLAQQQAQQQAREKSQQQAAQQARDEAAQQARDQATRDAARDPRSLARVMAADRGWGSGQFSCLDALWQKESGWNPQARNPSSGAGGIPQALPASKMSSAGSDWQTNPATQIAWGLGYIASTYGSPCAAWGHSQAVNWY